MAYKDLSVNDSNMPLGLPGRELRRPIRQHRRLLYAMLEGKISSKDPALLGMRYGRSDERGGQYLR